MEELTSGVGEVATVVNKATETGVPTVISISSNVAVPEVVSNVA
jgi:hypothetical protein